uniref:Lipase_3 domain-containing protein n=1 Tax=Rhabditophanes sp. KR3021 TaxID=114890 RepID=A0AC35TT82_9BILA
MPALVAFGRRWSIGSDDFVFPSIIEASIRFLWLLLLFFIYQIYLPTSCESTRYFHVLLLLSLINLIMLLLCVFVAIESSKGTIIDVKKRKNVSRLLHTKVPIFLTEVVCTTLAVIFVLLESSNMCNMKLVILLALLIESVLLCVIFIGAVLIFSTHGDKHIDHYAKQESKRLSRTLKYLGYSKGNDISEALDEVADILSAFFFANDFVLSDVLAGLVLHVTKQQHQRKTSQYDVIQDLDAPDWMQMNQFDTTVRFSQFSLAIYGMPAYLVLKTNTKDLWNYFKQVNFCCCCKDNQADNASLLDNELTSPANTKAFLLLTGIDKEDLIYISFENRIFEIPFICFTDHQTKSIVITIRGSASIHDFVTDLALVEEVVTVDIKKAGCEETEKVELRCHKGMLISARNILEKLQQNNILDQSFATYPQYQLKITGHSMGGAVASLLTLLLKQSYPGVRCYALSPPGCVVDSEGRKYLNDCVLSVIIGEDIVCRMSYHSLFKLKTDIENEIELTKRKKCEILTKGIGKLLVDSLKKTENVQRTNVVYTATPQEETLQECGSNEAVDTIINIRTTYDPSRIKLLPPGRLLHIKTNHMDEECVPWSWISPSCLEEIHLNTRVALDHFPVAVSTTLKRTKDIYHKMMSRRTSVSQETIMEETNNTNSTATFILEHEPALIDL